MFARSFFVTAVLAASFPLAASLPLIAQSTPSFELKRDTFPAQAVQILAQGDFNNDGKPDLIVGAGKAVNDITLRLGNGDGTFQPPVKIGTADFVSITDIAVADLNNDGKLDLIVVSENQSTSGTSGDFQIFFGNGDGTFQAPIAYTSANAPYSAAVGDFNSDGKLDLAIGEANDTVEIWNSVNGTGFVSAKTIVLGDFGNLVKVRTGNLNGDGSMQIAAMGFPGVFVLWNDGHENFSVVNVDKNASFDISVADVNQDGIDDILAAYTGSEITVNGKTESPSDIDAVYGQGNHHFFTRTIVSTPSLLGATSMQAADVNGDGIADIVASDETISSSGNTKMGLFVWLGNPDGSYSQTPQMFVPTAHNPGRIVAGDWNRDGMIDFAQALYEDNQTEIYINGGDHASCATSQISPTVTVCQPVNNTYLPEGPTTVAANAFDTHTVTAMQMYDNYNEIYSRNVNSFIENIRPALGPHLLVTKAWDSTGLSFRSNRNFFVYAGTPGPACPTTEGHANICLPSTSTANSPVQILANGWTPNVPTAAQLYIDNSLVVNDQACDSNGGNCEGGTSFLNTTQALPAGSHSLVFKLWDQYGNTYEAQKTINVR